MIGLLVTVKKPGEWQNLSDKPGRKDEDCGLRRTPFRPGSTEPNRQRSGRRRDSLSPHPGPSSSTRSDKEQ